MGKKENPSGFKEELYKCKDSGIIIVQDFTVVKVIQNKFTRNCAEIS
jgi:hypothetical protein